MSNPKRPKTKHYIFRKLIATFLVLVVVGALFAANLLINKVTTVIQASPDIDLEKFKSPESTIIYDMNGEEIVKLGLNTASNISYEQMPNSLVDAFISIEDSQFFEHQGVDMPRLLLTTARNFLTSGRDTGASTITMQTIKKSLFESDESLADVTYDRKIQEIAISSNIEKIMSKQQILELYVNKIQFGAPNSRGVQRAAEYYFGKDVSALTLSESAYLAGVINAPTAYNAYNHLNAATKRRNAVLDQMERHGYITPSENKLASSIPLENLLVGEDKFSVNKFKYNDYVDQVLLEAQRITGLDPMVNGMDIYTALNPQQQDIIEKIQRSDGFTYTQDILQSASVVLNNDNFEIVAIGGGKVTEETTVLGLNRARSSRQLGSAMKAVFPYMLAFEHLGWSTEHVLEDGPYFFTGTDISLTNANNRYVGDMTITQALVSSKNIPAVKTMDEVISKIGREAIRNFMRQLGYSESVISNFKEQYAIGGAEYEATPIQAAAHHAVAMNGGQYIEPHTIRRIEIHGQPPIVPEYEPVQIVSPGAAYMSAQLMKSAVDVTSGGTHAMFLKQPFPVYAKTGSSTWGSEAPTVGQIEGSLKDNWAIASTSHYTVSTWMGLDKASDGRITNANNVRNNVVEITNRLIRGTAQFSEPTAITQPSDVVQVNHILGVFPYARPLEGMDERFISRAYILKDNANLTDFSAPSMSDLDQQTVNSTKLLFGIFNIEVSMTPYPLEAGSGSGSNPETATKTMTATSTKSGRTITAEGRVLFDPSWVFGGVNYGTTIIKNGEVIEEIINAENTRSLTLLGISSNTNLEVCSFYTWASQPNIRSNNVCEIVNSGDDTITFPNFVNSPLREFISWINTNSEATYETTMVTPTSAQQVGQIYNLSPNYAGQNIDRLALNETEFNVAYYDQAIRGLQSFVGRPLGEFRNPNLNILTVQVNGPSSNDAIIRSITLNDQALNDFNLSDLNQRFTISISTQAQQSTVDKTRLEAEIQQSTQLVESDYTAPSWQAFQQALNQARQVYEKQNANQGEVNQSTNRLVEARNRLDKITE